MSVTNSSVDVYTIGTKKEISDFLGEDGAGSRDSELSLIWIGEFSLAFFGHYVIPEGVDNYVCGFAALDLLTRGVSVMYSAYIKDFKGWSHPPSMSLLRKTPGLIGSARELYSFLKDSCLNKNPRNE